MQTATQKSQLYSLVVVFFFWGFIAASNGIFIPFCKSYFSLSQFQSQLIDLTFYGGYFIGSLLLFLYAKLSGADLLNRIGYKKGIVYGLLLSAFGALAIIPSVQMGSYASILASYFLLALGFSLQQTCAQPYVIALGSPETGATRLNLAGGVNSFGTTIGPLVVSYVLFGSVHASVSSTSLQAIIGLYIGVACLFVLMALFFGASALPNITNTETIEPGMGALQFPQLRLGMLAILLYVGVEVTIQSNLGALLQLPEFGGYQESQLAPFISLFWGSLLVGRWTGAIGMFNLTTTQKQAAHIAVPLVGFALVLGVNALNGSNVQTFLAYTIPVGLMALLAYLAGDNQQRGMYLFSAFGLVCMVIGLATTGQIAILSLISGGLACSVLWPCIFSLSIQGLGKHTSQGSAFLIMMILGGAIIPPLQGLLGDSPSIGIHLSYIVTIPCFGYLVYFAVRVKNVLTKQGVSMSTQSISH
ncbi:MAG: MFS transporter [Bacteroidia bacterium]|jgi:FHS family L-fucose permease-like MFS transporter|nr:MFS transporter [Bacteroidia bacterium]